MNKKQKEHQAALLTLGKKIRTLRIENSLSQEEMAALADVHRTYIGMIERGEKNITIITLLNIAWVLNTTPAKILEGIKYE